VDRTRLARLSVVRGVRVRDLTLVIGQSGHCGSRYRGPR
jgi:hypothetical protein